MMMLLNDYTYYRENGNVLYKDGEDILDKIYAMQSKALDVFLQF